MNDKDALLEELRGRLEDYKARLGRLKRGLVQVTGATAAEFDAQMTSLREELQASRDKAHALAMSGDRACEDLRMGFDKAWHELRESFETATTHFQ
jgi:hypothetical protein